MRRHKNAISGGYPRNAIIVTPDTKAASASKGEQTDALDEIVAKLTPGDRIIVTDSSRLDRRENLDDQVATVLAIRATGAVIQSLAPGEESFGKGENLGNWITTIVKQSANAEKSRTVKTLTWRAIQAVIENKASYGPLPVFWEAQGAEYAKVATASTPTGLGTYTNWCGTGTVFPASHGNTTHIRSRYAS